MLPLLIKIFFLKVKRVATLQVMLDIISSLIDGKCFTIFEC